jgi:alginate O-acetyltransferase complex protein AlgI
VTLNALRLVVVLPAVAGLYYAIPHRVRWAVLLVVSYAIYLAAAPRYVVLLASVTAVTFTTARPMAAASGTARRRWLTATLGFDIGLLSVFKFHHALARAIDAVHGGHLASGPDVLLPLGISFFTFAAMSYTIDVHRGSIEPERHLGIFATSIAFFPLLLAGPIERPRHLLPQFRRVARWDDDAVGSGLLRVTWGLVKKFVIADRLASLVRPAFAHPSVAHGPTLALGAYAFLIQLYCDFSGLSDIAIGVSRMLGFDVVENFRRPFTARTVSEIWQRWHISLSSWFRDYLFIPLARRRRWRLHPVLDFFPVFVLIGLWHGTNATFVVFGALHASYMAIGALTARRRAGLRRSLGLADRPLALAALQRLFTFNLMAVSLIFFRAATLGDAATIIRRLPTPGPTPALLPGYELGVLLLALVALVLVERLPVVWIDGALPTPRWISTWPAAVVGMMVVLLFGVLGPIHFIYARF